jgi:hypothetical protein
VILIFTIFNKAITLKTNFKPFQINKILVMVGPKGTKVMGRMTAYAFFVKICRDEHKIQFPGELLEYQDFSKKCAERWKTMTDRERKWFKQLDGG